MRTKLLCAGITLGLFFAPVTAAEQKAKSKMPSEAEMKKMMEYGMPGEAHKVLNPLAGNFDATVNMWMAPGAKPEVSKGKIVSTWIHGGRRLEQKYSGEWNGQPFEGLGYMGHDNMKDEYQSVWMDNMGSGMMTTSGSYNPATKTITATGTFACPMTGEKDRWFRTEIKIMSDDKNSYTSYGKGPDGKEMKEMEILYTRVK